MRRIFGRAGLVLTIVIAVLSVTTVSVYRYYVLHQRSNEIYLQQRLWTMRRAIEFYRQDQLKAPSNLQELVAARYLREIPNDPICGKCPWRLLPAESGAPNVVQGIVDVQSTAPGKDVKGKLYIKY